MKNIKKIGVSALAGSLAMFSAAQADISITGGAEFTYTSTEGTGGASSASATGNPFGFEHVINFNGSGEMDNGFTYSVMTNIAQDMGRDSTSLTLDMGDLGTLGFDQGVSGYGISALENNVPTAYEEADHNVGTLAHGINVAGDSNVIGYINSFYGVGINLRYNPEAGSTGATLAGDTSNGTEDGAETSVAITAEVPYVDGLTLAYGQSKTQYSLATANDDEEMTMSANYSAGPVSVGYQVSEIQSGTADANGQNVTAYGIAFNVNENMSISYSVNENEADNPSGTNVTEESTGIMAAYTMGSASLRVAFNEADGVNAVAADTKEATEISLALAF